MLRKLLLLTLALAAMLPAAEPGDFEMLPGFGGDNAGIVLAHRPSPSDDWALRMQFRTECGMFDVRRTASQDQMEPIFGQWHHEQLFTSQWGPPHAVRFEVQRYKIGDTHQIQIKAMFNSYPNGGSRSKVVAHADDAQGAIDAFLTVFRRTEGDDMGAFNYPDDALTGAPPPTRELLRRLRVTRGPDGENNAMWRFSMWTGPCNKASALVDRRKSGQARDWDAELSSLVSYDPTGYGNFLRRWDITYAPNVKWGNDSGQVHVGGFVVRINYDTDAHNRVDSGRDKVAILTPHSAYGVIYDAERVLSSVPGSGYQLPGAIEALPADRMSGRPLLVPGLRTE